MIYQFFNCAIFASSSFYLQDLVSAFVHNEVDWYSYLNVYFLKLLVVGGSFGLREFTQIRYDAQKIKKKVCET